MRVLLLALDVLLTDERGDAIHVRELTRFLARRGNDVHLVTATPDPEGIDLGDAHHHLRASTDLGILRQCKRLVSVHGLQAAYERRLSPKVAFGVSRLAGIPFVVEVNGSEEELRIQGPSPTSAPWKRWLRRAMYRRAARVVAVTEGLALEVRSRYGLSDSRVVVVPNGVDTEQFSPVDPVEAQRRLGYPEGPRIVFVGNLAAWQGVDVLLRAMPRVVRGNPRTKTMVVGSGDQRRTLEALARELDLGEAVSFPGVVPHETVPLYIGASVAGVIPSTRRINERVGRSPLKAYEYLAAGRPIVASEVPGVAELVRASGGGTLVPPDDSDALADAILWLLDHPVEAQAMGRRGRQFVLQNCSWARTAERVETILDEAVG